MPGSASHLLSIMPPMAGESVDSKIARLQHRQLNIKNAAAKRIVLACTKANPKLWQGLAEYLSDTGALRKGARCFIRYNKSICILFTKWYLYYSLYKATTNGFAQCRANLFWVICAVLLGKKVCNIIISVMQHIFHHL